MHRSCGAVVPTQRYRTCNMSEEALAALGTEKAFSICIAFIKSGGDDGKGTGVSNAMGQGQDARKVRHQASHTVCPLSALSGQHRRISRATWIWLGARSAVRPGHES